MMKKPHNHSNTQNNLATAQKCAKNTQNILVSA